MGVKTGPRGVTIQDVQNVADKGSQGYVVSTGQPVAPQTISTADLANLLAGSQQPGYGQKYGGLGSQTNLQSAIKGNVYSTLIPLQAALQSKLASAVNPIQQQYEAARAAAPDMYGSMPTQAEREAGAALTNAKAADFFNRVMQAQAPSEGSIRDANLRNVPFTARIPMALGAFAAGAVKNIAGGPSPVDLVRKQLAQDMMRRLEAGRITGLENDLAAAQTQAAQERRDQAAAYAKQVEDRYKAALQGVEPLRQTVETVNAITPADYAQLIATRQYGMDPAVAAGLYGPGFNADVNAQLQREAQIGQPDFSYGIRDILYKQGGQELVDKYDQQQAIAALNGDLTSQITQATQQETLANAQVDNQLQSILGTTPGAITSNKEQQDILRSFMTNPEMQQVIATNRDQAINAYAEGADPTAIVQDIIKNYTAQTGDSVSATYMAQIIASFLGA